MGETAGRQSASRFGALLLGRWRLKADFFIWHPFIIIRGSFFPGLAGRQRILLVAITVHITHLVFSPYDFGFWQTKTPGLRPGGLSRKVTKNRSTQNSRTQAQKLNSSCRNFELYISSLL
jgi:hypothetical protein